MSKFKGSWKDRPAVKALFAFIQKVLKWFAFVKVPKPVNYLLLVWALLFWIPEWYFASLLICGSVLLNQLGWDMSNPGGD